MAGTIIGPLRPADQQAAAALFAAVYPGRADEAASWGNGDTADSQKRYAAGIVIATLADEQSRTADCWQRFCDLYNAARKGWPDPDPGPVAALTPLEFQHLHQAHEAAIGEGPDRLGFRTTATEIRLIRRL